MLTWINAGSVLVICAFYPSRPLPAYICSGGPGRANKKSGQRTDRPSMSESANPEVFAGSRCLPVAPRKRHPTCGPGRIKKSRLASAAPCRELAGTAWLERLG